MPENQPEEETISLSQLPTEALKTSQAQEDAARRKQADTAAAAADAAAKEAATETVTANLVTYPVITFKLHCTGTLPDGTQVEELVRLDYYIDGYDGIF